MLTKSPISIDECKKFSNTLHDNNVLEALITLVNYELLNYLCKNKVASAKSSVVVLKFSLHFGIVKNLLIDNILDLQNIILKLKEVFVEEGYKIYIHNQSDGTIIFSLTLPYDIEPTFV